MPTLALILNIVVLVPICGLLLANGAWAARVYGVASPARGILLALYLTILIASLGLLGTNWLPGICTLLALQVIYKVLSPFTVGTLRHPVVISNLLIAAFHATVLATMPAEAWA